MRENKTLADLIRELEDEVLANAGVDVFEEVFKLIYTKLFDEMLGGRDKSRILEFWNYGEIDFDEKTVRVARTLNLIAGDGKTNVLHLNTLDYERWEEIIDE